MPYRFNFYGRKKFFWRGRNEYLGAISDFPRANSDELGANFYYLGDNFSHFNAFFQTKGEKNKGNRLIRPFPVGQRYEIKSHFARRVKYEKLQSCPFKYFLRPFPYAVCPAVVFNIFLYFLPPLEIRQALISNGDGFLNN